MHLDELARLAVVPGAAKTAGSVGGVDVPDDHAVPVSPGVGPSPYQPGRAGRIVRRRGDAAVGRRGRPRPRRPVLRSTGWQIRAGMRRLQPRLVAQVGRARRQWNAEDLAQTDRGGEGAEQDHEQAMSGTPSAGATATGRGSAYGLVRTRLATPGPRRRRRPTQVRRVRRRACRSRPHGYRCRGEWRRSTPRRATRSDCRSPDAVPAGEEAAAGVGTERGWSPRLAPWVDRRR